MLLPVNCTEGEELSMKAEAIGFGSAGVILNATDGQQISLAGGRRLAIRIDSQLTAGGRMSMVTEDLPPGSGNPGSPPPTEPARLYTYRIMADLKS